MTISLSGSRQPDDGGGRSGSDRYVRDTGGARCLNHDNRLDDRLGPSAVCVHA